MCGGLMSNHCNLYYIFVEKCSFIIHLIVFAKIINRYFYLLLYNILFPQVNTKVDSLHFLLSSCTWHLYVVEDRYKSNNKKTSTENISSTLIVKIELKIEANFSLLSIAQPAVHYATVREFRALNEQIRHRIEAGPGPQCRESALNEPIFGCSPPHK